MATNSENTPARRIDDHLPDHPLQWDDQAANFTTEAGGQRASIAADLKPAARLQAIAGLQSWPDALHLDTQDLVMSFAAALARKLAKSEKKYGYTNGWKDKGWMDQCRAQLVEHLAKGDPRDVAAYCAFLWYHVEHTAAAPSQAEAPQTDEKHLPGWERGIATVTLNGHQLREALDFLNPDGDADPGQRDNDLTFGIVRHKDDDGKESAGMCCWNDDTDGVLPLDGEYEAAAAPIPPSTAPAPQTITIPQEVAVNVQRALELAMAICDAVPSRAHDLPEGEPLRHLGMLVNYQEDTGAHGYSFIRDTQSLFRSLAAVPEHASGVPVGAALGHNGTVYHGIAEAWHKMEEAHALHQVLDEKQVPRADADGKEYSLVGRVTRFTEPPTTCEHCGTHLPLHLLTCPVAVKGMAEGKKKEAPEPLRQLLIDLSNNTYFCGLHLSDDTKYAGYLAAAEKAEQGLIDLFEQAKAAPAPQQSESIDTPEFRNLLGDMLGAYRKEMQGGPSLAYEKARQKFITHINEKLAKAAQAAPSAKAEPVMTVTNTESTVYGCDWDSVPNGIYYVYAAPVAAVQDARNQALEEAAKLCEAIESDKFDAYKGRGKHEAFNVSRGDVYVNGESDGAGQCAMAIRRLKSGATPSTGEASEQQGGE